MYEGIPSGLTFDDVLLVPAFSPVRSRKDVDTSTKLSRHIALKIPVVSANMDTVTESAMAIVMAREGGIGVIHRFMSVKQQVEELVKVKRSESIVIEQPYTITPGKTVADALELMEKHSVGGILVTEDGGKLLGIVTSRDILFEDRKDRRVEDVMTKREALITANPSTTMEEARLILRQHKVEKLPLVDSNDRLAGLITAQDIVKLRRHPNATKDSKGRLRVATAIGVRGDFLERARALVDAGADALVIDVAHGHSENMLRAISAIRSKLGDVELMAGNIATKEGAKALIDAGVDAIKVGVGAGSICITRIVTGAGVPQLSAIMEASEVANEYGVPVIADGGVRNSGDLTKAIAGGASTVMIGSLLAGTNEAPGFSVLRPTGRYKFTRGMASLAATLDRQSKEEGDWDPSVLEETMPEGVEGLVPYKGKASEAVQRLVKGLRSGMSYCGATNLEQIRRNGRFIRITEAGLREGKSHDVELMQ